jgi:MFS family permease
MSAPRLGLRENLAQFSLLVVVNAFVGAMIGMERSILPALAEQEFHLVARSAVLSFIVVFGVTKALTNYLAGRLSDRFGRKPVLVGGWLVATPVPFLLMWAPSWPWVLFANVLLGVSQGLTWSTTVIMKIDLAGPQRRGLAMGLNEFAGYFAVAGSALATGLIAAELGLRPWPFALGAGYALFGLVLSAFVVRETKHHVAIEAGPQAVVALSQRQIFWKTSLTDRDLSSVSQAGLVNNLNDGMAWGLFPLFFAAAHMTLAQIGTLAAIYPATWGLAQLVTGAWSDRIGRKWLIVGGMWVQALGIALVILSLGFGGFALGAALLGIGTAMVYPTLLVAIGDVAQPTWRASAVGVYRLWRDLGYAVGAVLAGVTADALGLPVAMWLVAALTFMSGLSVAVRMRETLKRPCLPVDELRPEALVIDVRTPAEFEAGHIQGAINIPVDELPARAKEFLARGTVITACGKGGGRSDLAAEHLRAAGVPARPLCGGTLAWQQRADRS